MRLRQSSPDHPPHSHARRVAPTALTALCALALAACGGQSTAGPSSAASGASESQSGAAASPGGTVSIEHPQGTTEVPVNPQRIAVLDWGTLDTVEALGGTVVAVPTGGAVPAFMSKYTGPEYANAGTMQEPDLEAIAAADPDVILIGGRTAAKYKELAEIAPTVDLSLPAGDFLAAFKDTTNDIATILGKTDQASAALAEIDASLASAKAKAANAGTGLVLMTSGGKVSAFGPGSRFGLIHEVIGVKPAVEGLKQDRHGQAVSFEFVGKADPDRMFVIDRDAAIGESGKAAEQVLDNALVATTSAWTNKKVTYLDGSRWYVLGTGLTNVKSMIAEVDAGLS